MPLFSIVIPVRDRANMLRFAIQSALNQTFDDYEIVISDNCSSDNTPDVIKEFKDSRIRCFRTDRRLPVHENYEYVFSKADGEWVICMTSRFVIWRRALEKIAEVITKHRTQLVYWPFALYYTDTWFEPQRRNKMVLYHPYTAGVAEHRSDDALNLMFDLSFHDFDVPLTGFTAYHQDLLSNVRRKIGRIFLEFTPERSSCAAMLSLTEKFCKIDLPMMLSGICSESAGASYYFGGKEENQKFMQEYNGFEHIKYAPLKFPASINYFADAFLKIKALLPERLAGFRINMVNYFSKYYLELLNLREKGMNMDEQMDEFFSKLQQQPDDVRSEVLRNISKKSRILTALQQKLGPVIDNFRILRYLSYLITKRQVISGEDGGFTNIIEAESYLDSVLSKIASNSHQDTALQKERKQQQNKETAKKKQNISYRPKILHKLLKH